MFAKLDAARETEELLDDDDTVLIGKPEDTEVTEAERRIKHKLLPHNAWGLIKYFELSMSCPKDELHQWYEQFCLSLVKYMYTVGNIP